MPAAKGRTLLVLLLAVATAAPAAASIPSARHLDVDPATLLAAAQEPPAAPPAAAERVAFALFEEAPGDRFQLSPEARSDARFHLRPPAETRVWALDLPEPLRIRVELPPTRRSFKLYEHPGLEIPSEGTFLQQDPLGYVDGPSLLAFASNDPVNRHDPLGLQDLPWMVAREHQQLEEAGIDPYLFGRASPEDAAFIVQNVENYGYWWQLVGEETLTLPDRTGKGLLNLGPTLWRGILGFSDLGQQGFICVSDPGECAGRVWDSLRGLPADTGAAWNAWANRPADEHMRQWARATVDTAAAFETGRYLSPRAPTVELAAPRGTAWAVDPGSIRFSQSSIGRTFSEGGTLRETIEGLRSGAISPEPFPPIRVFERNGLTFTLDNRRLFVFQQAGVPIRTVRATAEEVAAEAWKFTTRNEGVSIRVRGGL